MRGLTAKTTNVMTNAKHTPGEWIVRKAIKQENERISIKSDDVLAVGVGHKSGDADSYMAVAFCGHCLDERARSNAKLIAAAPELLEASQFQVNLITKCIGALQRHIVPGSTMSDSEALSELYGILDNTEMVLKLRASQEAIKKATN